ncbi:MAG: hypothetical protein HZA53_11695 [Planctomycetes bacterium]|nr:hypothetical protein [Planctomycetota bacterium]
MKRIAWWEWVLVATLVALGFFLRAHDITAFKLSPDDGQYMNSARLQFLERSADPVQWFEEDAAWFGELSEDWGHLSGVAKTYQHSYLHQFLFRYLYRLGLSCVEALRLNVAWIGALTVFALFALYAWNFPWRRRAGLFAAALLSVLLVHVFLSRTGWGEVGSTFCFVVYVALGWRLLASTDERDTRALWKLGLGLALASTLGMGFHEITSVYVVGMCAMACASPWWRGDAERGVGVVLRSRRVWAVLLSSIPVGAYTLALRLWSDYANEKWFASTLYKDLSWGQVRVLTFRRFWETDHLLGQVSMPLLVLAIVGAVALRQRDRVWFRYAITWSALTSLVFLVAFNDPSLVRIYLPTIVLACWLAGEGLVALGAWIAPRAAAWVAGAAGAAVVLWLGLVTWTTLFGSEDDALFESGVYVNVKNSRNVDEPWLEYLEDHRVTAQIGVYPTKDPLFVALDAGFTGRLFSFEEPQSTWTDHLLAANNIMQREGRRMEDGGRYRLVAQDKVGRIGLYALQPAQ